MTGEVTTGGGATGDLDTLRHAAQWARAGHDVAVATVIETWGSAPRRRGSILAIRADGVFEGSVSGGCVEGDVITEAQALLAGGGAFRRLDYGVADETAWAVGLACGGRIGVLVQRLGGAEFVLSRTRSPPGPIRLRTRECQAQRGAPAR